MGNTKWVIIVVIIVLAVWLYSKEGYVGIDYPEQTMAPTKASQVQGCKCAGLNCNTGKANADVFNPAMVPSQTLTQPSFAYLEGGNRPPTKEATMLSPIPSSSSVMPYDMFAKGQW